ncbi:hypothetical protein EXIGLDRAFT_672811 [Exidia glandulosa HHB12029]|uniref:Uncharacterized protein n=1 Tax=Exidia glandulosa HHB12029 TaxID=1314781 RepID=A0A165JDZ4_EXIGL|nr:hypothetical protein EXIGLDRAFT_672811 [Exidia glandulosa HHB12029]
MALFVTDLSEPEFPHPFHESVSHMAYTYAGGKHEVEMPRTLVEQEICALSATLRAKPHWYDKYRDPMIRMRWEQEALAQGLTQRQVDYVFDELDAYRAMRDEATGIEVSCCDRTWQSDRLIPPEVADALKTAVHVLEDVPDAEKDWHPRADGLVLDLVHPSLYPLVYGRTLVRKHFKDRRKAVDYAMKAWYPQAHEEITTKPFVNIMMEKPYHKSLLDLTPELWTKMDLASWLFAVTVEEVDDTAWLSRAEAVLSVFEDGRWAFIRPALSFRSGFIEAVPPEASTVTSARFQWLPTDFQVGPSTVTAKGLINNLNPVHRTLYRLIERILGAFIPMFDRVLTDILPENDLPLRCPGTYDRGNDPPEPPEPETVDDEADYDEAYGEWFRYQRTIIPPEPVENRIRIEDREREFSLRDREIQVIVKLANIILTPDRPEYPGGSWHVEGMKNEHIVASGIFYYDEENITESRLAFRTAVREPLHYEQNDERGCVTVWGLANDDPLVQDLGSVETKEGRCIAFPNILQHRVSPFKLVDPSKPGHRKILAFFLVDPNESIPSTSTTGFQRREWIYNALRTSTALAKLPDEILLMIMKLIGGTMSREEAFAYREDLMDERTRAREAQEDASADYLRGQQAFFAGTFNMCEH